MLRLGKFFRKKLGKLFRGGTSESRTEQRGSEGVEDSGQTSALLGEQASPDASPLSQQVASDTAKSEAEAGKVEGNTDHSLRIRSESNTSKIKSLVSSERKSTDELDRKQEQSRPQESSKQVESSAPHLNNSVLDSERANEQDPVSSDRQLNPNPAATGITDSVQAIPPFGQANAVSEDIRDSERVTNAIHVSAPADSALPSGQLGGTHADPAKDMISRPQKVPSFPHNLSDLPDSTSLRHYLERTSDKSSTKVSPPKPVSSPKRDSLPRQVVSAPVAPPRQVSPPRKAPEPNRQSVPQSRKPVTPPSPRPATPAKSTTPVAQPASVQPSSSKKSVEVKEATKPEATAETAGKSATASSTPEEDVSIVSLVEVSDSTKEVIGSAMKKFGMREMTTEGYWNVRWSDNGVSIQMCQKLQKFQRINRFPGGGLLMMKNNLARNTGKMKVSFPNDYDFVPETWCLAAEIMKVEMYARVHDRDCFIVKPNDGSSGKGIIITRNVARLKMCEKMVCQVYIRRPYLIDGFKFDLRIYTLVTSCKPLRIFVYNEGLARFATEPYQEPNAQNESNKFMHLTNYAVNKRSPSYTVGETKGTLRRLSTINKWLLRNNVDAKKVWDSMDDAIIKTIISFLPALRHNYRVSFPEQNDSNSCFQILGFDIIFDENLKPYVLEVNDSPSFKADVPLDKEMTDALMHDTFGILHLDENNRSKVLMEEKRVSRQRLLSSSVQVRNAIQKEKEHNERLLTQSRVDWEDAHMGNFRKVYPNPSDRKMKHYRKFIREAQDIFTNHI